MNRRTFILGSFVIVVALHRAEAQTVSLSDQAIRHILRRRIDVERHATGMAVGIIENGHRRVIVIVNRKSKILNRKFIRNNETTRQYTFSRNILVDSDISPWLPPGKGTNHDGKRAHSFKKPWGFTCS
jgi:hypothetical protein